MKKIATAVTVLACVAVALAAEHSHKAYMFAGTNFGIMLPAGFSRDDRPGPPPNVKAWAFTNAAQSRLTFTMIGPHVTPKGQKMDFKGFAALEYKTNLVRWIVFDSSWFSHAELEKIGRTPEYDARLEYRAANTNDKDRLDESIDSFFVNKKKESNKILEGTGTSAPDPQN